LSPLSFLNRSRWRGKSSARAGLFKIQSGDQLPAL
jgi:hypothetical protein